MRVAIGCLLVGSWCSCTPAPPRVHVQLAKAPFTLSSTPTVFTPEEPLRADNYVVTLCLRLASGYAASDEFTILTPEGKHARVTGVARLTTGATVPLTSRSQLDTDPCVDPEAPGPLAAAVRAVELVSTEPVHVTAATWHSTDK